MNIPSDDEDTRFSPPQAADYLNCSTSTLAKWRSSGTGPEFIRAGPRLIQYRLSALDAHLKKNTHKSTSEY